MMAAMKFPLTARWTEEEVVHERKVSDVAGAMSLFNELDALGRHHPTMVEFENGDGGAIAIGAGSTECCAVVDPDLDWEEL
jgi:hypothetical protein